jgi:hypothetical protein
LRGDRFEMDHAICLFFVRAQEAYFQLEVDFKDVDQTAQPKYTPWITNMDNNIDTTLLAASSPQRIEHAKNNS